MTDTGQVAVCDQVRDVRNRWKRGETEIQCLHAVRNERKSECTLESHVEYMFFDQL